MLQLTWITFTATIIGALFLGGLLSQLVLRTGGKDRASLRRELSELKKEHQTYQINVTEHFSRTTTLISQLNDNYQQIQEHLSRGAEEFVKPEFKSTPGSAASRLEDLVPSPSEEQKGPRDYADKRPDEEGTLSETYGLKTTDFIEKEGS